MYYRHTSKLFAKNYPITAQNFNSSSNKRYNNRNQNDETKKNNRYHQNRNASGHFTGQFYNQLTVDSLGLSRRNNYTPQLIHKDLEKSEIENQNDDEIISFTLDDRKLSEKVEEIDEKAIDITEIIKYALSALDLNEENLRGNQNDSNKQLVENIVKNSQTLSKSHRSLPGSLDELLEQTQNYNGDKNAVKSPSLRASKSSGFLLNQAIFNNSQIFNQTRAFSTTPPNNRKFSNKQSPPKEADSENLEKDSAYDEPQTQDENQHNISAHQNKQNLKNLAKLFSIGCGFSKDDDPKLEIQAERHCIAANARTRNFGEDAAFIFEGENHDVLALSDGVGGWRSHGVDPSKFSFGLMRHLQVLVENEDVGLKNNDPISLLSKAFKNLENEPERVIGSATACLGIFDRKTGTFSTANLGDSGFLIIRDGKIVHKSTAQQHFFNAPYQLAIVPPREGGGRNLQDLPEKSDFQQFQCQKGDVIVMATDGMFDNVHNEQVGMLLQHLGVTKSDLSQFYEKADKEQESEEALNQTLTTASSTFVAFARMNAHKNDFVSPFTLEAKRFGYNALGGKVDDITILVSVVGGV